MLKNSFYEAINSQNTEVACSLMTIWSFYTFRFFDYIFESRFHYRVQQEY